MRIGLDTQVLSASHASGFGYYVSGLLQALQSESEPGTTLVPLSSRWKGDLSTPQRWYHDFREVDQQAHKVKVDLIHQPSFSCPRSNLPVVWTIHDLRAITANESMSWQAALYWKYWLPRSHRFATQIVCTSENTRWDLATLLHLDTTSIPIIPVGLPQEVKTWRYNAATGGATQKKFGITGSYFASVGTIQPVKNFPFLVDVLVALRQNYDISHQLVLIGKKGWDYPAVAQKIASHGLIEGRDVIITDYVSDEEKWSLIHDAEAFLFPSRYEGFGIPPIEAQSIGTPVMVADNSSLPEVIGDGGIRCATSEVMSWVAGYQQLTQSTATLVRKGKANCERFEWSAIAGQWLDCYKQVLSRS